MRIFLSLLVLACVERGTFAIQFEDDAANLEQAKIEGRGFFPTNDEPDDSRYSAVSGIKYVDIDDESLSSENRKQLNFNGNLPVRSPPTQAFLSENQFYQQQQQFQSPEAYRPSVNPAAIRKRPNFPYQYASPSNYQYTNDLSSPFYQNYANYYQQASSSSSPSYYDYYYSKPTRYTSTSVNLYGHPLHQQQQQPQQTTPQFANYYANNYANQFAYQRPSPYGNAPGLAGFANNIRESASGSLNQFATVGTQFSKALEDISINDDLQCVPKLLCQMIRNPRRPNQLPSFLNIPGMTAIISALPSTSPLMNFGRAALLGLSGGHCDSAYPKCPRDENQLLYYLNTHRGGFFRFFNGGNSFGDIEDGNLASQQPTSQGLNMLALQALADTLSGTQSGGSGFNLNSLFGAQATTQRPTYQADQSAGLLSMLKPSVLSDVVSNLLTGVVGNRFSRQLSKRSITDRHRIEKRIVNVAEAGSSVKFLEDSGESSGQPNTLFDDLNEKPLKFSNDNRLSSQQTIALKFPHETPNGAFASSADVANRIKMLFPDVDSFSEQFQQNLLRLIVSDQRYGKIVTGGQRPASNSSNNYSQYSINRYPASPSQSQNYYAGSGSSNYNSNYDNRQPQHTASGQSSKGDGGRNHIVYITNAQGQIEYTLNELTGEKKRYL